MWIKRPTRCHFWYYVYFSFIDFSTCFGPRCAHLQELTTCSYLSDVLQSRGCVGSQIRLVACLSIVKHLTQHNHIEIRCTVNHTSKVASSWFSLYSAIKMKHGPINIRLHVLFRLDGQCGIICSLVCGSSFCM